VANSDPNALKENIHSIRELHSFLEYYSYDVPLIVALNKRDLPNAVLVDELVRNLRIEGLYPIFETIAVRGVGVKRVFREAIRFAVLYRIFPDVCRREIRLLIQKTTQRLVGKVFYSSKQHTS